MHVHAHSPLHETWSCAEYTAVTETKRTDAAAGAPGGMPGAHAALGAHAPAPGVHTGAPTAAGAPPTHTPPDPSVEPLSGRSGVAGTLPPADPLPIDASSPLVVSPLKGSYTTAVWAPLLAVPLLHWDSRDSRGSARAAGSPEASATPCTDSAPAACCVVVAVGCAVAVCAVAVCAVAVCAVLLGVAGWRTGILVAYTPPPRCSPGLNGVSSSVTLCSTARAVPSSTPLVSSALRLAKYSARRGDGRSARPFVIVPMHCWIVISKSSGRGRAAPMRVNNGAGAVGTATTGASFLESDAIAVVTMLQNELIASRDRVAVRARLCLVGLPAVGQALPCATSARSEVSVAGSTAPAAAAAAALAVALANEEVATAGACTVARPLLASAGVSMHRCDESLSMAEPEIVLKSELRRRSTIGASLVLLPPLRLRASSIVFDVRAAFRPSREPSSRKLHQRRPCAASLPADRVGPPPAAAAVSTSSPESMHNSASLVAAATCISSHTCCLAATSSTPPSDFDMPTSTGKAPFISGLHTALFSVSVSVSATCQEQNVHGCSWVGCHGMKAVHARCIHPSSLSPHPSGLPRGFAVAVTNHGGHETDWNKFQPPGVPIAL
eukprot:365255-Chlamydomonas_euryale.AAC.4